MTSKHALKSNNNSDEWSYIAKFDNVSFAILLVLIVWTAFPIGESYVWIEAAFEVCILMLTTLWLIAGYFERAWLLKEHRLLLPLFLLAIYAFIQAVRIGPLFEIEGIQVRQAISKNPYETWLTAQKFLTLTLFAGLLLRCGNSLKRLQWIAHVIIGVALVSALFGLLQRTEALMTGQSTSDGFGQFANRNHFALLMEMALGLTFGMLLEGNFWRIRKLAYLAIAFVLWMALILTYSRGAIIIALCQMAFIAFLVFATRPFEFFKKRGNSTSSLSRLSRSFVLQGALVALLLITAGLSVVWIGGDTVVYRLRSVPKEFNVRETYTGESRLGIWQATFKLIKANPIVGVGFGEYGNSIAAFHQASGRWTPQQAHNEYLELVASGGIIGGLIGAFGIVLVVKFAITQLRQSDALRQTICIGALTSLLAVALHSLVDFGLHIMVNALVCLSLIVLACANVRERA
jgi:O-antigen ligase